VSDHLRGPAWSLCSLSCLSFPAHAQTCLRSLMMRPLHEAVREEGGSANGTAHGHEHFLGARCARLDPLRG
jgi:hypothetical protein